MLHSVCNQCNWFSNRRTNVKRCFKQTILSRSPRSYKHRPSPLNSFHLRIRMDPEMIRMDRQLALKRTEQALWPFWIWFGQSNKQVIRMQILWRCSFPVRAYVMNTNIVSFFLYSFIYSLSQSVICLDLYIKFHWVIEWASEQGSYWLSLRFDFCKDDVDICRCEVLIE